MEAFRLTWPRSFDLSHFLTDEPLVFGSYIQFESQIKAGVEAQFCLVLHSIQESLTFGEIVNVNAGEASVLALGEIIASDPMVLKMRVEKVAHPTLLDILWNPIDKDVEAFRFSHISSALLKSR